MIENFTFEQLIKKPLTEKQIEVLHLISQTYSKQEIAQKLVISKRTVKRHIDNLSEKIYTNWTSSTETKMQRLGLVWQKHKSEIIELSKQKGLIK